MYMSTYNKDISTCTSMTVIKNNFPNPYKRMAVRIDKQNVLFHPPPQFLLDHVKSFYLFFSSSNLMLSLAMSIRPSICPSVVGRNIFKTRFQEIC